MQRMPKLMTLFFLFALSPILLARAIIDADVLREVNAFKKFAPNATDSNTISLLIFLTNTSEKKALIATLNKIPGITIQDLGFMPAVAINTSRDSKVLNQIAEAQAVAQISYYKPSSPELDVTAQILKLAPSSFYPEVNNWWKNGYTGKKGIVGIIDTGIDLLHPALSQKKLIVQQEDGSGYSDYINGVKAPHGTGVACIYASNDEKHKGIAYGVSTIITGFAGEETADTSSIMLTMRSLDWMVNHSEIKPTIINYSMGNGKLACLDCTEWSGLAKIIDYVINTKKILWVKSAGNMGYITPTYHYPFASTLTVPGDNYNGLTIANMDTNVVEDGVTTKTTEREKHSIKNTSSRGPTPFGRRKPDLTAPGHDTRTCAPDPTLYHFKYTQAMDYKKGYRLMGGTSSAAPHVGAAALLLQDAGIQDPIAIKALLINSADTWADEGSADTGHTKIIGSAWSRTYGWGYVNMEKAFNQRKNIIQAELTLDKPSWEYTATLQRGEKITLVHERRVGYAKDGNEWKLSHLALEIIDMDTNELIDSDSSPIDTVHQVSNCKRELYQKKCSIENKIINAVIKVKLLSKNIDGSINEPFAIVSEGTWQASVVK